MLSPHLARRFVGNRISLPYWSACTDKGTHSSYAGKAAARWSGPERQGDVNQPCPQHQRSLPRVAHLAKPARNHSPKDKKAERNTHKCHKCLNPLETQTQPPNNHYFSLLRTELHIVYIVFTASFSYKVAYQNMSPWPCDGPKDHMITLASLW